MSELETIVQAARALRRRGEPYALATLVRVEGSSYRRPGARMLMTPDRWIAGSVSGGCLEGDVVRKAWWRTASGAPALVTYDSTSDDDAGWGFGLGCNGVATILVERVTPGHDPLAFVERVVAGEGRETRGALATVFRTTHAGAPVGARLALAEDGTIETTLDGRARDALLPALNAALAGRPAFVHETDGLGALIEPVAPPPQLFIVGAGHDALPLVTMARAVGWRVTVFDRRGRMATRARFAEADHVLGGSLEALEAVVTSTVSPIAVLMSHDFDVDRDALGALLRTRAAYIGVLGPRRRTERMLEALGAGALSPEDQRRLHAPVGLAIGAETPQEIALAIVAEAQAALAGAGGGPLRDRSTPIHARRKRWACAVLAAGGSRRLGRPKQLVPFRGRPLVRHVAEQACAAGCDEVAVVVGAHRDAIAAALDGLPVRVLENDGWSEGVASSIRLAAGWAAESGMDAVGIALADQPGITAGHLARLAAAHHAGARRVGSAYSGIIGVPAVFDARDFRRLVTLEGDRGAAAILAGRGDRDGHDDGATVAVPWPEGALDVDTPRDLQRLERPEGTSPERPQRSNGGADGTQRS